MYNAREIITPHIQRFFFFVSDIFEFLICLRTTREPHILSLLLCSELAKQTVHTNHSIVIFFNQTRFGVFTSTAMTSVCRCLS